MRSFTNFSWKIKKRKIVGRTSTGSELMKNCCWRKFFETRHKRARDLCDKLILEVNEMRKTYTKDIKWDWRKYLYIIGINSCRVLCEKELKNKLTLHNIVVIARDLLCSSWLYIFTSRTQQIEDLLNFWIIHTRQRWRSDQITHKIP